MPSKLCFEGTVFIHDDGKIPDILGKISQASRGHLGAEPRKGCNMLKYLKGVWEKINVVEAFKDNIEAFKKDGTIMTIVIAVICVIALVAFAIIAEKIADKRAGRENDEPRMKGTRKMVTIAVLSAIAIILNLLSFPLPFLPSFYKVDFSELPVVLGAFVMGPLAGIVIEFIKIMLNIILNGTSTAFVGEFANFIIGCAFVVPAATIYTFKRSKVTAAIGLGVGTVVCCVAGVLLNAFVLLPMYSTLYHMSMEKLIGMGTDKNKAISNMLTFVLFATTPLNLIKCVPCSIVSFFIYKPVRKSLMK